MQGVGSRAQPPTPAGWVSFDAEPAAPKTDRKSFDDGKLPADAPPGYDASVDHAAVRKFTVKFLVGDSIPMEMEESFTVRLLKLRIEDIKDIPVWNQTLVAAGEVLNDDSSLKDAGIHNGTDVYCLNIAPEQERAAVGVPKNHEQVDCPTCGILIAVPPGMDEFECPRCDTVCRAPPKYAAPEPPAQFKKQLSMHRAASSSNLKKPGGNVKKMTAHWENVSAASSSSSAAAASSSKSSSSSSSSSSPYAWGPEGRPKDKLKPKELSAYERMVMEREKEEREENAKRYRSINYPHGDMSIWIRAFWIVQCPILNLWWYFEQQRMLPKAQRTPWGIDWYDTEAAKKGNIWGWVVFCLWAPFYIWMLVELYKMNLLAAIISIMFGPLVLLIFLWDINATCNWCCGGYGNRGCDCYCYCGNINCDGCCDACGSCCSDACGACGDCCSACGSCNCSGCDCGGCDC